MLTFVIVSWLVAFTCSCLIHTWLVTQVRSITNITSFNDWYFEVHGFMSKLGFNKKFMIVRGIHGVVCLAVIGTAIAVIGWYVIPVLFVDVTLGTLINLVITRCVLGRFTVPDVSVPPMIRFSDFNVSNN